MNPRFSLTWNSIALSFNTETLAHVAVALPQRLFLDTIYSFSCSQRRNYSLRVRQSGKALSLSDATGDSSITCCQLSHLQSRRMTWVVSMWQGGGGTHPQGHTGPCPSSLQTSSLPPSRCTALTLCTTTLGRHFPSFV